MIEKKKVISMLWGVAVIWLGAGLLVGCNPAQAGLETPHSSPAPAEAHSTEVIPLTGEIEPGTPMAPLLEDPTIVKIADQARRDLAGRLSISVDQVELREVRKVTWPDSSLGCPQAGATYVQEPQAGLLIRLSVSGSLYFYHSAISSEPFLCENSPLLPDVTPKFDEFVPPPDEEID